MSHYLDQWRAQVGSVSFLNELEAYAAVADLGFSLPVHRFLASEEHLTDDHLSAFSTAQVVVKLVSRDIQHKSEVGGVRLVPNDVVQVRRTMQEMKDSVEPSHLQGFVLLEQVSFQKGLGHEWLLGVKMSPDFGPMVIFGVGGIYTEFLSRHFARQSATAILPCVLLETREALKDLLQEYPLWPFLAGGFRGERASVDTEMLIECLWKVVKWARLSCPDPIREFEINPLVVSRGSLVALDALVRLNDRKATVPEPAPRPLAKIDKLLRPKRVGLIGVSQKMNPGHVILNNLLREGFTTDRIAIVKPGETSIEGCLCYPEIKDLPQAVDLMVLAIDAQQTPDTLSELIRHEKAESIVVIPGGFEEKEGAQHRVLAMKEQLAAARQTPWGGPVINGGNCVGFRSEPGSVDTFFIPPHKLALPNQRPSHVAVLSQSGAYAVAIVDRLAPLSPRYTISLGNQTDLTFGDYLQALEADEDCHLFACYVEGFKPLDGVAFARSAQRLRSKGKRVVVYLAGRTEAGAKAKASHTASVAGDALVTRRVLEWAGVLVTEDLNRFERIIQVDQCLTGKTLAGVRLAGLSNAGFECVAIADQLGDLRLTSWSEETQHTLEAWFQKARIGEIVDIHNPLDLTPMMNDHAYVGVMEALLADDQVDLAVFGIVPLTGALNTLAPGEGHLEDFRSESSVIAQLVRLWRESSKPFVVVLDGGVSYAGALAFLNEQGIPAFSKMDEALHVLNAVVGLRGRSRHG
jgi:acyl-CoA synthetase (NDP forming)